MGYADRRAVVDPEDAAQVITSNGIFRPLVLYRGRAAGTWKAAGGTVEVTWCREPPPGAEAALDAWTQRWRDLGGA